MDAIVKQAEILGRTIAAHPRRHALLAAEEALENDEVARQLREDYDAAVDALQRKLASGDALEPDEKRREAELRSQVSANETLARLVRAQADFQELMIAANQALERAIGL
jgi:cell fate (sporulation/competence/biofilm development) regulator YlbF (YheA/YmcA/DUF963 family)